MPMKKVIFTTGVLFLFLACYRDTQTPGPYYVSHSPGSTGGSADVIWWTILYVAAGTKKLITEGLPVPVCTGSIVENDGKRPIPDALVVLRVPRAGKMFMARSQADGSFTINVKEWWTGTVDIQITALATFHGRAMTITGQKSCRNLVLTLPALSGKEWEAFRDSYIKPVIASSHGPMWDVDAQSRGEVESFAKVLY